MTALATRPQAGSPALATSREMNLDEVNWLAERIAASRMFGCQTAEQAFALMMLAQSQGIHPMEAVRRYHVIEGRPAMRSDAMQAEFQARGGRIRIIKRDATEAKAEFSHPELHPEPFEFSVTYQQFKDSGMIQGKDGVKANWRHHAADMLWARLVTKAIRTIYPGIVAGIYSEAEAEDMAALESPRLQVELSRSTAAEVVREAEAILPGQPDEGSDQRPFHEVVRAAAMAVEEDPKGLAKYLWAAATSKGLLTGPKPTSAVDTQTRLAKVYSEHRDLLRQIIAGWVTSTGEMKADQANADAIDVEALPDEPGSNG